MFSIEEKYLPQRMSVTKHAYGKVYVTIGYDLFTENNSFPVLLNRILHYSEKNYGEYAHCCKQLLKDVNSQLTIPYIADKPLEYFTHKCKI